MGFACSEASYTDVLDGPGLGSRGLSKPGQHASLDLTSLICEGLKVTS